MKLTLLHKQPNMINEGRENIPCNYATLYYPHPLTKEHLREAADLLLHAGFKIVDAEVTHDAKLWNPDDKRWEVPDPPTSMLVDDMSLNFVYIKLIGRDFPPDDIHVKGPNVEVFVEFPPGLAPPGHPEHFERYEP
jgi:hypothetical protein